MHFAAPAFLLLLTPLSGIVWARWPGRRSHAAMLALPTLPLFGAVPHTRRTRWMWLPAALRAAGLALAIVALARPQAAVAGNTERLRGRNIVLALDISSSMKAVDIEPGNRLEVAKRVLGDFIERRRRDFMGLVVFASEPFTQAPLTDDRTVLQALLRQVDIGMLPDGTAIGTALAMSENQLKDMPRGSGVIVLVTDGGNNTGAPSPATAAAMARALGIRIYAVGVSSRAAGAGGGPLTPGRPYADVPQRLGRRGEARLRRIATMTGGRYYRATDAATLGGIMRDIDHAERGTLTLPQPERPRELAPVVLVAALLLLLVEVALRATWLRALPEAA